MSYLFTKEKEKRVSYNNQSALSLELVSNYRDDERRKKRKE
jgi:hypothetical protein